MITVLTLILALQQGPTPLVAPYQTVVERQTYVMGTILQAEVAAPERNEAIEAIEEVFENTRRLERMLSSWMAESEISRINTAPVGEAVEVSDELLLLLREAALWSEKTGGAFDPAVGALTDAWDLRGAGRIPGEAEVDDALRSTGARYFNLHGADGSIRRLKEAAWIDTGGFGKGVALRQAEAILRRRGISSGQLDFGGQILVVGTPADGTTWRVAVADPRNRQEAETELQLESGSVSTSSQSERFVTVSGERYGHIIDPRSGRPVPSWGSVTVIGKDPVAADILSTALLVMGPAAGLAWAERQDSVAVLFLENTDGGVRSSWNEAFERYQP